MAVSDEQLRQIRHYFNPGEQIVWAGQPNATRAMRSTLPVLLFAVPWTAFALFWTAMAGGMAWFRGDGASTSGLFALFGLPFIAVGIGMLLSPYWAWRRAQKTLYAVTNQRAIVGTSTRDGFTITGFLPHELIDLTLTVRQDGSGSIDLRSDARRALETANPRTPRTPLSPGAFADIPDVQRVFDLLRQLARSASPEPTPLLDADPYGSTFSSDTYSSDFAQQARRDAPGWKTPGG